MSFRSWSNAFILASLALALLGGCVPPVPELSADLLAEFDSRDRDQSNSLSLSEAQDRFVAPLNDTFADLDTNGNGTLSRAELEAATGGVAGAFNVDIEIPDQNLILVGADLLSTGQYRVTGTCEVENRLCVTDLSSQGQAVSFNIDIAAGPSGRAYEVIDVMAQNNGGYLVASTYERVVKGAPTTDEVSLRQIRPDGSVGWAFEPEVSTIAQSVEITLLANGDYLFAVGPHRLILWRVTPFGVVLWRQDFTPSDNFARFETEYVELNGGSILISSHDGVTEWVTQQLSADGEVLPDTRITSPRVLGERRDYDRDGTYLKLRPEVAPPQTGETDSALLWTTSRHAANGDLMWLENSSAFHENIEPQFLNAFSIAAFDFAVSTSRTNVILVGYTPNGSFVQNMDYATGRTIWNRVPVQLQARSELFVTPDRGVFNAITVPGSQDEGGAYIAVRKINSNGNGASIDPTEFQAIASGLS